MRVLAVKRYSGEDEAGAMDRQHQELHKWSLEQGSTALHWVEDETVSGSVNLDERKSLGQWLREPLLHEWDVMAVTTQDRVTRDDMHWWQFVGRLIEWGKRLVVLDDPQLDLNTPNGRMIAGIKATQAANYRLDVKKKAQKARESFREQRRYAGGHWPYGYRAVPRDGEGWKLEPDPETSELVREAFNRLLGGDSLRGVVRDWTQRGIPTARDHQRATKVLGPGGVRQAPKGYGWNETSLKRALTSPALLGYASYQGEIIREDGLPVQWAEPILEVDEFMKLQEILADSGKKRSGVRENRSPLLGVVFCKCGWKMSRKTYKNKRYTYYVCGSQHRREKCSHTRLWPEDVIQTVLEENFLTDLGDAEIQNRTYVPGKDNSSGIASLKDAIDNLSSNLASLPAGSRAAQATIDKMADYEKQLDELEAEPIVPASWSYKGTGVTFGEKWRSLEDWEQRGMWLLQSGVKAYFAGSPQVPEFYLYVPEDLIDRAQDSAP